MPKTGGRVRIWSAASSDGQEPYSIALTVFQAFPNVLDYDFKILATDIDPKILAIARQGTPMTSRRWKRCRRPCTKQWFQEVEINGRRKFQVDDKLKRLITYNELNLMAQWPFKGMFDVIFCRNVVIYFDEPPSSASGRGLPACCRKAVTSISVTRSAYRAMLKNHFDNIGITTYRYTGKYVGARA